MKQLIKKLVPSGLFERYRRARAARAIRNLKSARVARKAVGKVDSLWRMRIQEVIASPDNAHIERHPDAGKLQGYTIVMHNGVRVCANGYYGGGVLNMLIDNRGVHEPQEERAFEEIIRLLPERCSMLELGAYWCFYSLSLLQQRPKATCYLVEPESQNLISGKLNFRLNQRRGDFTQAYVGKSPATSPRTIAVDAFCAEKGIEHLDILHSDIQGFELDMLEGARGFLTQGKASYVFISTHSSSLHAACLEKLQAFGYSILAEADLTETFSFDGLIVAKHASVPLPERLEISKKPKLPGAPANARILNS